MKHLARARGLDMFTLASFAVSILLAGVFLASQLLR